MKFIVLFVTACVLGSAVAHPGWLSSMTSAVSDTTNGVRQAAVNTAKATTNAAVNTAKATTNAAVSTVKATTNAAVNTATATTNAAVSTAKATTDLAVNAAGTAKNMTVNTAMAGVNIVKDLSMSAIYAGIGYLIKEVKAVVKKSGKNVISIPDIVQKAGPIHFNATKGYFKDVTTLVQNGKANVTTIGTSLKIDFPLKLDEIDIGYEQFNVTMNVGMKMNVGGGIKVHIKNDTFIVHMRLTPGFTCALNVEKIDVAILTGYDIDFTNVGKKSEWLLEKSSSLIINAIKGNIKSKVQTAIDSAIKAALKEDSTICSKFLG